LNESDTFNKLSLIMCSCNHCYHEYIVKYIYFEMMKVVLVRKYWKTSNWWYLENKKI